MLVSYKKTLKIFRETPIRIHNNGEGVMYRIFILGLLASLYGCGSDDSGGSDEKTSLIGSWEYEISLTCNVYFRFLDETTYTETTSCYDGQRVNTGTYTKDGEFISLVPFDSNCKIPDPKTFGYSFSEAGELVLKTGAGILTFKPSDFAGEITERCRD